MAPCPALVSLFVCLKRKITYILFEILSAIDHSTGEYPLPGSFESKKVGGHSRSVSLNEALLKSLGGPTATSAAPSIPTKHQSYGYESGPDGRLSLQDPLYPVYSGKRHDAVGPCEYDPKIDVKYKSAPKTSFGKVD